jgi:hypothetical protein
MTHVDLPCVDPVDTSASETEIEITPAMMEAGGEALEEFYLGNARYSLTAECLRNVYSAMARARPAPGSPAHQTDSGVHKSSQRT